MKFQVLRIAALTTLTPCDGAPIAKTGAATTGTPFTIELDEPV